MSQSPGLSASDGYPVMLGPTKIMNRYAVPSLRWREVGFLSVSPDVYKDQGAALGWRLASLLGLKNPVFSATPSTRVAMRKSVF